MEGELGGDEEGELSDCTTVVEKTTVVELGAADGPLVVADIENDVDEVRTGDDGKGEPVERDDDCDELAVRNENVCVIDVGEVSVAVEVRVNPDTDGELVEKGKDDEIAEDGVVPDAVDGDVSERTTSELELKVEDSGRLVPALVVVSVVGPEVTETLEPN